MFNLLLQKFFRKLYFILKVNFLNLIVPKTIQRSDYFVDFRRKNLKMPIF